MISENSKKRVVILCTHPVQYYTAWYRALAKQDWIDLEVWFGHKADAKDQADAGFGVPFEWDIPLLDGYRYRFLNNRAFKPGVSSFFGTNSPEIGKILDRSPIDALVVHGWASRCYLQGIFAANMRGIPVYVRGDSQLGTVRKTIWRFAKKFMYRWLMNRFTGFLAVGSRSKEYYLYYGAKPQNIFPSPHFVDNDFFAIQSKKWRPFRDDLRSQWGISKKAIVFAFVGKLVERKRPMDFLIGLDRARDVLNETNANLGAKLTGLVIGDGPGRLQMETWVHNANIPVSFAGFLNQGEIAKAYVVADCLILPSDGSETWGLVVNEAFACGIPAIVSNAVGCSLDMIEEGKTGWVYSIGNCEQLAKIIIGFLLNYKIEQFSKHTVEKVNSHSVYIACESLKLTLSIN